MEGLLVHFGKNAVAAFIESLFLYKYKKHELGFQALPCKKSKVGKPFSQICKAFYQDIKYYVIIYTEICEDLH